MRTLRPIILLILVVFSKAGRPAEKREASRRVFYTGRVAGGLLVAALIAAQTAFMGWRVIALDLGLLIAFALWIGTEWRADIGSTYLLGLAAMVIHFAEEYAMGFHRAFGGWEPWRFIVFNACWFVLFAWAAWRKSYLIILFFAVGAGIMNGVGHLLLALRSGGYFPGLWTSPLMLIAGVAVLRRLYAAPASPPAPPVSP
ncbi:MAG TPA: HXXEE domain-containing protein [Thermoanaerobaculia bacterium]|nr:HXXEE domain-containing protein [Thermoanaerobaculia bacterium]